MSDPTNEITIGFATESDVSLIHELIGELAAYEKLSHQVEGTPEQLREALFGERPGAEVLIARDGSRAVGFALFFHNFSTFLCRPGLYLEDLFVREEARGRGIGQRLLAELARIARDRGCGRMEWWVLDWNEPAIGFYKRLGAEPMDEWTVFRLDRDGIANLAATER